MWSLVYPQNSKSGSAENLTHAELKQTLQRLQKQLTTHFEITTQIREDSINKNLMTEDTMSQDSIDISLNSVMKQSFVTEPFDGYNDQQLSFHSKDTGTSTYSSI